MKKVVDPNNAYADEDKYTMVRALGVLPIWAMQSGGENVINYMLKSYGFPKSQITGGFIDADGVYKYAGDPDLQPILKLEYEKETLYFYKYAIVGSVKGDDQVAYRMD